MEGHPLCEAPAPLGVCADGWPCRFWERDGGVRIIDKIKQSACRSTCCDLSSALGGLMVEIVTFLHLPTSLNTLLKRRWTDHIPYISEKPKVVFGLSSGTKLPLPPVHRASVNQVSFGTELVGQPLGYLAYSASGTAQVSSRCLCTPLVRSLCGRASLHGCSLWALPHLTRYRTFDMSEVNTSTGVKN